MLWLLSGSLLVTILLLSGLLYLSIQDRKKTESTKDETYLSNLELLTRMNSQLLQQNQNLFDRVQAKDLPSYVAMTHLNASSEIPSDEYIPRDDQSEYERMAEVAGLGDSLMDEPSQDQDFIDLAAEIGIELKEKQ